MHLLLCSNVLYINVCISMYHTNGQITVYLPICFLLPSPLCCPCAVRITQPSNLCWAEVLSHGSSWVSFSYPPSPVFPQPTPPSFLLDSLGPLHHLCPKPGLLFPEVHSWAVKRRHVTLFLHLLPFTLPSQKTAPSPSLNDHLLPEKTGIWPSLTQEANSSTYSCWSSSGPSLLNRIMAMSHAWGVARKVRFNLPPGTEAFFSF